MPGSDARLIDGNAIAGALRADIAERAARVRARGGVVRLDAVLATGSDSAALVYAQNQARTCAELGIDYELHDLGSDCTRETVEGRVLLLNQREDVAAVMVHMPLPEGIDPYRVQRLIDPDKDIEGVNPANIGNIVYGRSSLAPCTGLAAVQMIESTGLELRGKRCVVVGASNVVGKPIAVLLMRQDATVVSANEWTWGLEELTRSADVLVSAVGRPRLITGGMVKPGAVVVDVGTTRVRGDDGRSRTVGDVAFDEVSSALGPGGWISPVPGGVGPVTVAVLLRNVVTACEGRVGIGP